ncbi:MAG TPA: NAD(+) diphosphatase [Alcaligenes faecalis]|nr:NAD(+) diphosphatase [Alcaligenes faecalis]
MNFIFRGNEILVSSQEEQSLIPTKPALGLAQTQWHALFSGDSCQDFAAHVAADTPAPEGTIFRPLRGVLAQLGEQASIVNRAFQVSEWARSHRYCGVCGSAMERVMHELCFRCTSCGFSAYPRISPAMMVLIRDQDRILLASHSTYATARYTALAGFVEAGENLEEAIHREVLEEVGLRVDNIRYFGSQSWPFPHSLMVAYTAEYAGGDLRIQADEINDARWFGPGDTLPDLPHTDSIAGRLIRAHLPRQSGD